MISIFQAPDGGKDPETNENLHKSTVDLKKFVQDCIIQEKMQIGDDVFLNIKLILCVDMKCLTEILGISAVYNHKTKYGCCWCNVIRKKGDGDTGPDINDFSKSTKWEFRDIKQMQEIFNTNLKTKVNQLETLKIPSSVVSKMNLFSAYLLNVLFLVCCIVL